MYRVMISDDQKSSHALMKYAILSGQGRYTLIKAVYDADLVLGEVEKVQPDLLLLDIYTGGRENGLDVAGAVRARYPNIKIIILTYALQKKHIEQAKAIGCEGFWYKDHADMDLLDVMDGVMAGETYYPLSYPVVVIGTAKSTDFTAKELQILQAKIDGYSSDEICAQLDIKLSTLKTHMANIRNKTGYTNFVKLVADIVSKKFIISDAAIV